MKGTRWQEDQSVPEEWIVAGYEKRKAYGLPRVNLNLEAERFANFWASKSGRGATHVNWKRTWMNWCLNAYGAVPESEPVKTDTEAQRCITRVKLALAGTRLGSFDLRRDVPVALRAGQITKEQAKQLGYTQHLSG